MSEKEEAPPFVRPAMPSDEASIGVEVVASRTSDDRVTEDIENQQALGMPTLEQGHAKPPAPAAAFVESDAEVDLDPTNEMPRHQGVPYDEFLAFMARTLDARLYLEIGTRDGYSLRRIGCPSISIDPDLKILSDVIGDKPSCHFYQMTSDAFFRTHDIERMYGQKISLAFLDGLHRFEFLLRDFINTERYCERGSVIVMHDCHPINIAMTERVYEPALRNSSRTDLNGWWTGDVWKLMPILRRYRPDMRVIRVDCPPTGLVICTNFDPTSNTLTDKYFDIIEEFGGLELSVFGLGRLYQEFPLEDSHALVSAENFTRRFLL